MGGIYENNRTKNLNQFKSLLNSIKSKWPNVEFMHTAEIGNLIISSND
jgi:hypothetical protein